MKTKILILGQQVFHLYWNNVHQLTTINQKTIYDYIANSCYNHSCNFKQFKIVSNYCNDIPVDNFMTINAITNN